MTQVAGAASLKLFTGWSPDRSLCALCTKRCARTSLTTKRTASAALDSFLAFTDAGPAAIRDWLAPVLSEGEAVFVMEFERWSGSGPSIDRDWLLRRGH